ncbi:superoxide dismutase family protein [Sporosarcina sp. Sa2YVA2]|uniref:Superoxide dismutase [Cu-Zn] n=1 Tax=Sporosarcina quadrami TaxID=2762234 RepID=A0ABR8UDV1_9BACL|nr:superoxide dismutase family protein [Sporosarcina quadrami]MBD7985754.1 superoxide dismutase family protein [Sporosarcina quadrami]
MKKWKLLSVLFTCTLVFAACADEKNDSATVTDKSNGNNGNPDSQSEEDTLPSVTVQMMDSSGKSLGTVQLTEEEDALRIMVDAHDLPEGSHGFHFHEKGVCEAPDFESTGGHFNPTEASHGLDSEGGPHAGDLPNLVVGADGEVKEEFFVQNLTLKNDDENSLFQDGGTALVIHADSDDGKTQPSGDSGDRIACGIVE